ncbi:carboxypeptidase-like regulatory domain-containing protein [Hymenobacter terrenus]|uniref:carboxypeptidase-like regulatory domain-containing protein n=1 Tax=Hymenobacter terrenus TaxID=1629124 RepID=UPI001E3770B4|nr:carboxypeptidase-like regulatory domain-containing protein [Hymenobacter terrenus]
MKRFLFSALWLLILLPVIGQAQESRITGRVVDAQTKQPIPFASILLIESGTGTLTNEKGYFQLAGLDKFKQDSLVLVTLGYRRYAVFIERGKVEDMHIELRPKLLIGIPQCPIVPYTPSRSDATRAAQNEIITGLPGTQYAFFIKNKKQEPLGKFRTVSFYIGKNGFPRKAFRVRIYGADGPRHSPNISLFNEGVFRTVPEEDGWYTRDLSSYNIVAPKEGYFIAVEFGNADDAAPQPDMDRYMPSGQIMWPSFELKKSNMWGYTLGKGWNLLPLTADNRRYNALVRVEVNSVK